MAKKQKAITAEYARQLFDYDPGTGVLRWKARTPDMFMASIRHSAETQCKQWNGRFAGNAAGSRTPKGYLYLNTRDGFFIVHHIIWLMVTGTHADHEIDHKDGDTSNNRFSNFRPAGPGDNAQNRKINSNNQSGIPGVYWMEKLHKWKTICCGAYLGLFDTAHEATAAYLEEKSRRHKFQPSPRYLAQVESVLAILPKEAISRPIIKRVVSIETREKIRIIRTGSKHTPETKIKMSLARMGRICSIETRAKISAAKKSKSEST